MSEEASHWTCRCWRTSRNGACVRRKNWTCARRDLGRKDSSTSASTNGTTSSASISVTLPLFSPKQLRTQFCQISKKRPLEKPSKLWFGRQRNRQGGRSGSRPIRTGSHHHSQPLGKLHRKGRSLLPQHGRMAKPHQPQPLYYRFYPDNNEIGDDGVEYLTHANWKRLNSLNLGKNGITFTGAQHIMEGKWSNLASLNLWGNDLSGE